MSKKIVVITGSPRKKGNSFAMTEAFIQAAEAKGHNIDILRVKREARLPLRRETATWQAAAVDVFGLSLAVNLGLAALHGLERQQWEAKSARLQSEIAHAQEVRDHAVRELGALAAETARDRQARAEQAEAYEAMGAREYLGEFTVTAYCPCGECCGRWADGVTASGLPAGPGIVAVDPDIIPTGSTVVIDGQVYLAADTGVAGNHVDVCVTDHRAAEAFGVRTEEVWVELP